MHLGGLALASLLLQQQLFSSAKPLKFQRYVQKMSAGSSFTELKADASTLLALLRRCCGKSALHEGKCIHALIIDNGFEQDRFLSNHLLIMYSKCGGVGYAKEVFDGILRKNVFSWTAMIRVYAQNDQPEEAFDLFNQMLRQGVNPNMGTFTSLLNICSQPAALQQARKIHSWIKAFGFELNLPVANSLINVYGKCGSLGDACVIFEKMGERDVFSWTTMIDVYAKHGISEKALELFQLMQVQGIKPNKVTIVAILNACGNSLFLAHGRMIHAHILESKLELDVVGWTALVNMYGKCGCLWEALKVFNEMPDHNEVSWNTLISAYAQSGKVKEVLDCFYQMKVAGLKPSRITFTTILNACSTPADLTEGRLIYTLLLESKIQIDVVLGTALIKMFEKCGGSEDARQIFDGMVEKNVLTWTAMITAYTQCGKGEEAFGLFKQMQQEGIEPDKITFVSLLDACASLPSLQKGKLIHEAVILHGYESDLVVATALMNMYSKCGKPNDAHVLFSGMLIRDIILCNTMVNAYAQHGHGAEALQICGSMQWGGMSLNEVTLVSIVSACNHAGLLEEGYHYFDSCENACCLPTMESYRCITDLGE